MLMTMSFHSRNGIIAKSYSGAHYFYGHISDEEPKVSRGLYIAMYRNWPLEDTMATTYCQLEISRLQFQQEKPRLMPATIHYDREQIHLNVRN